MCSCQVVSGVGQQGASQMSSTCLKKFLPALTGDSQAVRAQHDQPLECGILLREFSRFKYQVLSESAHNRFISIGSSHLHWDNNASASTDYSFTITSSTADLQASHASLWWSYWCRAPSQAEGLEGFTMFGEDPVVQSQGVIRFLEFPTKGGEESKSTGVC